MELAEWALVGYRLGVGLVERCMMAVGLVLGLELVALVDYKMGLVALVGYRTAVGLAEELVYYIRYYYCYYYCLVN